ncbi:FUSC family protein [Glutamicibacter endophyticus]|uniref:FUSC family protein n=1 Tax=Glutamicibacter endophyticus TaxID=1522174 RepID=UPI003AEFEF61
MVEYALKPFARSLITLGPATKDHWIALRTAVGIFAPLTLLLLLGRLDLMVYVVFGAFTGVYGRVPGYWNRLRMQARSGLMFFILILGAMLASKYWIDAADPSGAAWQIIGLTTVVAGAGSVVSGLWQLRPTGSLFHIFAFAAIASLPRQAPMVDALLAAGGTILLALGLGAVGSLGAGPGAWARTELPKLSSRIRQAIWWEGLFHVLTAGAAGVAATLIAPHLSAGHTYWAMVAAVVPLAGHTTRHRVRRGLHRVLGTLAGMIFMLALIPLNPPLWALVLTLGCFQFLTEMFVLRNYFLAQIFVTPMALVGVSLGTGLGGAVIYDRIIETVIGSCIGVLGVVAGSLLGRALRKKYGIA